MSITNRDYFDASVEIEVVTLAIIGLTIAVAMYLQLVGVDSFLNQDIRYCLRTLNRQLGIAFLAALTAGMSVDEDMLLGVLDENSS